MINKIVSGMPEPEIATEWLLELGANDITVTANGGISNSVTNKLKTPKDKQRR